MTKITYLLWIIWAFGMCSFAEMRFWRTVDDRSFFGEFEREKYGNYYFRDRNGQPQVVKSETLIPSHLEYIRTLIPPELELAFRMRKEGEIGRYADPDTTLLCGVAKIKKISRSPFLGTLRGELYFIAEEFATPDVYMMLAKKQFEIKFLEDPVFEVQMDSSARVYEEFNGLERRGREYAGYLLVVTDSSGEVVAKKTDLNWLDDNEIDTVRHFPVFTFFDEDGRRKSTPRPQHYSQRGDM